MSKIPFDPFYRRLAERLGLSSQQELAQALGVNRSAITQAKNRNSVPDKWLLTLSKMFGLSPAWLETGRDPLGQTMPGPSIMDPDMPVSDMEAEYSQVPKVRARLCAGGGSFEVNGAVEDYYAFRRNWLTRRGRPDSMVLMDIMGNSMEPEIHEGDTVLVDQSQRDVIAGGIYAVGVEDTVMVKRLEKRPGALVLLSDNRDYTPILLQGDEIDNVRIIGKLIWVCREYR